MSAIAYELSGIDIVIWFGLQVLQSKEGTELAIDDFIDLWTAAIPISLSDLTSSPSGDQSASHLPLDLTNLVGNYIKVSPSRIIYFTKSQLSDNPKTRFAQLLAVKSTWELNEIVPFLEDIRNKSVKMESFIMKFAKKKTVGKRVYVSAR